MENERKAFREIIEILSILPAEVVTLIPQELIQYFSDRMDREYECHFEYETLDLNQMLEETKDIFTALFITYWSTDEQCAKLLKYYQNQEKMNNMSHTSSFSTSDILKKIHDEKINH